MKGYVEMMQENFEAMEQKDDAARQAGKLVGRYIDHPYADGRAYYEIIREAAKTVRIRVVRGLGDDWVLPAWGEEATIEKRLAQDFIERREAFRRIFARRG